MGSTGAVVRVPPPGLAYDEAVADPSRRLRGLRPMEASTLRGVSFPMAAHGRTVGRPCVPAVSRCLTATGSTGVGCQRDCGLPVQLLGCFFRVFAGLGCRYSLDWGAWVLPSQRLHVSAYIDQSLLLNIHTSDAITFIDAFPWWSVGSVGGHVQRSHSHACGLNDLPSKDWREKGLGKQLCDPRVCFPSTVVSHCMNRSSSPLHAVQYYSCHPWPSLRLCDVFGVHGSFHRSGCA